MWGCWSFGCVPCCHTLAAPVHACCLAISSITGGCDCSNLPAGTRVLHSASLPLYSGPCPIASTFRGMLGKCVPFTTTGRRTAIACAEHPQQMCWSEVAVGTARAWVMDHAVRPKLCCRRLSAMLRPAGERMLSAAARRSEC